MPINREKQGTIQGIWEEGGRDEYVANTSERISGRVAVHCRESDMKGRAFLFLKTLRIMLICNYR